MLFWWNLKFSRVQRESIFIIQSNLNWNWIELPSSDRKKKEKSVINLYWVAHICLSWMPQFTTTIFFISRTVSFLFILLFRRVIYCWNFSFFFFMTDSPGFAKTFVTRTMRIRQSAFATNVRTNPWIVMEIDTWALAIVCHLCRNNNRKESRARPKTNGLYFNLLPFVRHTSIVWVWCEDEHCIMIVRLPYGCSTRSECNRRW